MSDTITITGNIATAPEIKRTAGGVTITTFRVASPQRRYDRASASWIDGDTNWYTASMYRSLAEHAFSSLDKGHRVLLTGRLRLRQWDTGTKQGTTAEIDVEAIGHDLLWGTTRFEKDAPRAAAGAPGAPDDARPDAQREETDLSAEWAVPALGAALVAEDDPASDASGPREADRTPVTADAPF